MNQIKYLEYAKFNFILNCLNYLPSWEIVGEIVGEEEISKKDVAFVVKKINNNRGVSNQII